MFQRILQVFKRFPIRLPKILPLKNRLRGLLLSLRFGAHAVRVDGLKPGDKVIAWEFNGRRRRLVRSALGVGMDSPSTYWLSMLQAIFPLLFLGGGLVYGLSALGANKRDQANERYQQLAGRLEVQATDVAEARPGGVRITGGTFTPVPGPEATPTPLRVVLEVVTPTPVYVPPGPDTVASDGLPVGYRRQTIVGRFSNYWPPLGGINCHNDCEYLADGSRTDQAIREGWRVVACPPELLLGTRIEWPPGSGVVWVCRDRGQAITFYYGQNGLPIYWFDFLNEHAFVDYGSYIQVDLFVPIP